MNTTTFRLFIGVGGAVCLPFLLPQHSFFKLYYSESIGVKAALTYKIYIASPINILKVYIYALRIWIYIYIFMQ